MSLLLDWCITINNYNILIDFLKNNAYFYFIYLHAKNFVFFKIISDNLRGGIFSRKTYVVVFY